MRAWFPVLLVSLASAAVAQPGHQGKQASIQGAPLGAIRDWHADDAKGIYLRDRTNRWYYGAFRHQCPGVLYGDTVSFKTFGGHDFDRSSQVVTQYGSCALESLVESPAPRAKGGKATHAHR